MKASEYFKACGFDEVRYLVSLAGNARVCCIDGEHILVNDLKRLVESHELIESCGGLDLARKEAHKNCFDFNAPLLKAILDVESCQ
jgi:hypothetical protein